MAAAVALFATAAPHGWAQEEFEGWNLEPALAQAHLVMVARVVSVSQLTVVEGAKTDVALREYRFQPVRRLKGIFQREQLSMTASDLGTDPEDASSAPAVNEGEFRLLILVQRQGTTNMGCVSASPGAASFAERVPQLSGPDDPLVAVVETLIQVADSASRRQRAKLLVDRLVDAADGPSVIPLLTSLRARADWAAGDPRTLEILAKRVLSFKPVVRGAALDVLSDVLTSRGAGINAAQIKPVAAALREVLVDDPTGGDRRYEGRTNARLQALAALAHVVAQQPDIDWARDWLTKQIGTASTHVERAAAAAALSRIDGSQAQKAVLRTLATLPLDEPPALETIYAHAALRRNATQAQEHLQDRLRSSIEARQSLQVEVDVLAQLENKASIPLLLYAVKHGIASDYRHHIARALGRLRDDSGVPVLIGWLRRSDQNLKMQALTALENIDSPLAAREARPLLKTEANLSLKLRIARLLARHQITDGYALATEHLADAAHTAEASLVLAALDDPRTRPDLSAILATRLDRRWYAAALSGLAAIGDREARQQLRDILANDRNPLVADAAAAAGVSGDKEVLLPLAALVRSRNKQISMAALVALDRFLHDVRNAPLGLAAVTVGESWIEAPWGDPPAEKDEDAALPAGLDIPPEARAAITAAVREMALDAYVEPGVRRQAFGIACMLRGEQYAEMLAQLADQAELEGSPLLKRVQAEQTLLAARQQK